jgi:hypothetical protein
MFAPINLGDHAFKTPGRDRGAGARPLQCDGHRRQCVRDLRAVWACGADNGWPRRRAVAVFSESGKLEVLLGGPHNPLAAPRGIAIAPNDFGQFSGDLLVGNFSYLHS